MISISISNNKLKIAEGYTKKGHTIVNSALSLDCAGEVVSDGIIMDAVALQVLINQVFLSTPHKSKDVAITVESSEVIVRDFQVPKLSSEELTIVIRDKMTKMINKEEQKYLVDYSIIDEWDDNQYTVMAYAIPQEIVNSYYDVIKGVKLNPKCFDVIENTRTKLLTKPYVPKKDANSQNEESTGTFLFVDIGKMLSYYGISNDKLVFSRKDASPLVTFLLDVGYIKKSGTEEENYLDELNFTPGYEHGNISVDEFCNKFILNLADAIPKYIQYLMMNVSDSELEKIIICGDITLKPGLDIALQEQLNVPVVVLETSDDIELLNDIKLTEYADCIGALIRR